jgi:YD repeat-containing protein
MAGRSPSALSRIVSTIRAFLRDSWISRIDLADWLTGLSFQPARRRRQTSKPKQPIKLAIEGLEYRSSPDDPLGVLQSAWMGAAGTLLTPGVVLLRGWAASQFADTGVLVTNAGAAHVSDTALLGGPPYPGMQRHTPALPPGEQSRGGGTPIPVSFGTDGAAPSSALGLNGDPFANPFQDDWLNAVGDMLDGKQSSPSDIAGGDTGSSASSGGSSGAGAAGLNAYNPSPAGGDANHSNSNLASLAGMMGAATPGTSLAATVAPAPATAPPVVSAPAASGGAATPQAAGSAAHAAVTPAPTTQASAAQVTLDTAYAKVPLAFEPNMGQTAANVQFLSRGSGLNLFLTDTGAVLESPPPNAGTGQSGTEDVLGLQFVGANPDPQIVPGTDLLSRSNYFSNGQAITNVPQYSSVTYENLYPGINLTFQQATSGSRLLEYDFTVAPGANPAEIQLAWQGAQSISTDGQGDLLLQTGGQQLVQSAPVFYQAGADGAHQAVNGQQVLAANGSQMSFQASGYDPTKPLVIDPTLGFSSYLGGSGGNAEAYAVAVDANGSSYITGSTAGSFPTTVGAFQTGGMGSASAFITKFAPNGSLVYSTYLSGGGGANAYGIAVDSGGNAYVTGQALSSTFPTTVGAYQTTSVNGAAFVSKLNATGSALDYSTLLGGHSTSAVAIAIDPFGNAYVTGSTAPTAFATTSGAYQTSSSAGTAAFVTKFNPEGSALVYSSFLSGSGSSAGQGIALGQSSTGAYQAYVTGYTSGSTFPTSSGAFKTTAPNTSHTGFVTALNAAGSGLVYSTFLGGSNYDAGNAIAVDLQGNAYITGLTKSTNFPTTSSAFQTALHAGATQNAFVTKLNPAGTAAVYSTYVGGSGTDAGNAIAVDGSGQAYITGQTSSCNFPTVSGAFQATIPSMSTVAFVTRVAANGQSLSYSSYLGGAGTNVGTGIAVDLLQNAYVVGYTNSSTFPTVNAYQGSQAGTGYDAFISKVVPGTQAPVITAATTNTSGLIPVITTDQNLTLSGTCAPGATITLDRADLGYIGDVPATSTTGGTWSFNYTATTLPAGAYSFTATATLNSSTSPASTPFLVTVDLTAPSVTVVAPATTYSEDPQIIVQASELNGLPDGTTVTLLVDVNRNGSYSSSQTAPLVGGYATFTSPTLAVGFSYNMKAQVTDPAGNTGTSAVVAVQVNSDTPGIQAAGPAQSDPIMGNSLLQMGNLQLSHALDLDTSPDGGAAAGSPALTYNSAEVSVKPVVQASILSDNSQALPSTVSAVLTWNGTPGATYTYNTTGAQPGDLLTLAIQEPTTVTSTGAYSWSLSVVMNYGTPVTYTSSGTAYVVTEDSSPFGSGWSLSSVDQIVSVSGGVMFVYGSGFARFWSGSGTFTAPAGDNGTLTYASSVYTYTMPDNEQLKFNSSGYETSWTAGDGLSSITYSYNGSNQLTSITATDGTTSTFSYSGSLVSTIQTSNSRTTTLSYSGTNLTQITDPSGGTDTYTYDSAHHATGETFGNTQNSWAYNSSGALATITTGGSGSPTVEKLAPAMLQGLSSLNVGDVYAVETDPALGASTYTYATKIEMNLAGETTKEIAADGGVTQYGLNSDGYVTTVTDPMNRTTTYALDSDGYVTQTTYPDSTTSESAYQSGAYHLPTTTTDQNNNVTTYAYDALGHLTTVTDPLGDVTTYAYSPTTGLMTSETDPDGNTTTYAYDSLRRLTSETNALPATTTFTYDSNGNPNSSGTAVRYQYVLVTWACPR